MQHYRNDEYPPVHAVRVVELLVPRMPLPHSLDKGSSHEAPAREENQQDAEYVGNSQNKCQLGSQNRVNECRDNPLAILPLVCHTCRQSDGRGIAMCLFQ